MLLTKEVEVRWNGSTKNHYVKRGFIPAKMGEYFICPIEDVISTSTVIVNMECDYCNKPFTKEYRYTFKKNEVVNKDACKNCKIKKQTEVMLILYGVKNNMQLEENKERARKASQTSKSKIVKVYNDKNLKLVSDLNLYKNDRDQLSFICLNHEEKGIQTTMFSTIKRSTHCCKYGSFESSTNKKRIDGNVVFQSFINNNFTPMFNPKDYISNNQALPYICKIHNDKGIQYRNYANINTASGCFHCSVERRSLLMMDDEKEVFDYLATRGLFPLKDERYSGKSNHIKFECEMHVGEIQSATYQCIKASKIPCKFCREENSISILNRKLRSSLYEWKLSSEKDCKFQCVLTKSKIYEIHHLYSYNNIIKESLAELNISIKTKYSGSEIILIRNKMQDMHKRYPNGICIRKDIHTLFHQIFSKHNNTFEQFETFKCNYEQGLYNERLKELSIKTSLFS